MVRPDINTYIYAEGTFFSGREIEMHKDRTVLE
jgi:hypothetical protein